MTDPHNTPKKTDYKEKTDAGVHLLTFALTFFEKKKKEKFKLF